MVKIGHVRGAVCGGKLQAAGRAPLPPRIQRLLDERNLPIPPAGHVLNLGALDAALAGERFDVRMSVKCDLRESGLLN